MRGRRVVPSASPGKLPVGSRAAAGGRRRRARRPGPAVAWCAAV